MIAAVHQEHKLSVLTNQHTTYLYEYMQRLSGFVLGMDSSVGSPSQDQTAEDLLRHPRGAFRTDWPPPQWRERQDRDS